MTKTCIYCKTINPEENAACLACGAPLGRKERTPLDLTPKVTEVKPPPKPKKKIEVSDGAKKAAKTADKVYDKAIYTYAVLWRTLSEAVAIAIAATIVGLVGGASGMRAWGIIGGIVVGVFVGRSTKYYYWTLISAPIGALLGLGFSVVFWLAGIYRLPVFIVTIMACGAAAFRSRPARLRRKNFWESARPYLGALAGWDSAFLGCSLAGC